MTEADHPAPGDERPVDLSKQSGTTDRDNPAEAPFDPYRFGAPDVPPPPEYAPPGYIPPAAPPSSAPPYAGGPYQPYGQPPTGTGTPPYPQQPPYPQHTPYPQQSPYSQQSPYPQYPAGAYPPPPGGPGYPPPGSGSNGRAVAGLVLGILSLLLFWTSILDAVLVVLAIIFGSIGLSESKWKHVGRGQALAGLICAAVGAVLAIGFTVWAVHVSRECSGYSSGSSAYEHCIRDHI